VDYLGLSHQVFSQQVVGPLLFNEEAGVVDLAVHRVSGDERARELERTQQWTQGGGK